MMILLQNTTAMVDAVMVDANARKPDELICKQVSISYQLGMGAVL